MRGLLNWDPHWSILCIAADNDEEASSVTCGTPTTQEVPGQAAVGIDLVKAHVTLSLKLEVPMAVVITKLDLASRTSLQKTVGKILTVIKQAGRVPKILQPDANEVGDLQLIPQSDSEKVRGIVDSINESGSLTKFVPIVLTSAVKGKGIGLLHALLKELPLPPEPTASDYVGMALNPEQPKSLFHIDDTYSLPASYSSLAGADGGDQGVVVSGHLRFGSLSVGDRIVVGPFPSEDDEPRAIAPNDRPSPSSYGLSLSHPASAELAKLAMKNAVSAANMIGEWHPARVVSVRNLRLPVRTLGAGQAGSIGLVFENRSTDADELAPPRIRRGMVLAIPSKHMLATGSSLQAASGFTALFSDPVNDSIMVGSFVNVYVASIRATARVTSMSHGRRNHSNGDAADEFEDIFTLNDEAEDAAATTSGSISHGVEVSLELLNNREWVELGSRVVVLEGASQDRSGLEGYVGRIVEIVE
jgi:hypothetical protein